MKKLITLEVDGVFCLKDTKLPYTGPVEGEAKETLKWHS